MLTIETKKFPNMLNKVIEVTKELINQAINKYPDMYYLCSNQISPDPDEFLMETQLYHIPNSDKDQQEFMDTLFQHLNPIIKDTQIQILPNVEPHLNFQQDNMNNFEIHISYHYLTLFHYYLG